MTARPLTTDDLPAVASALADELERRGLVRKLAKAEPATERMTPERRLKVQRKVDAMLRRRGLRP